MLGANETRRPKIERTGPSVPLIAILGPPCAGKTSITARLSSDGFAVFRLREFAMSNVATDVTSISVEGDPLRWLPDRVVERLLTSAFTRGGFATAGKPVLIENFPGNPGQVRMLAELAAPPEVPVAAIEFVASDVCVRLRSRTRRVCPTCEPDRECDPHKPAAVISEGSDRCARCGGQVRPRRQDSPAVFDLKLHRYRDRIAGIREEFRRSEIPYEIVNAEESLGDVEAAAREALAKWGVATSQSLGVRSHG